MIVEEMQQYYGKRAAKYDSSMEYNDEKKVAELQPVIRRLQEMLKGKRVLELACGPGFWTQFVAETAEHIVATDYNQSTLEEASKKDIPKDRVQLLRADAYGLDGIEGSFDAMFAVDWFAHVPLSRMNEFLSGLVSRLKEGASIVFVDQLAGSHSVTGVFDDEGNHIQERTLEDGSVFRVIKHFFSDEELENLFSRLPGSLSIQKFSESRRVIVEFQPRKSAQ